MTDLLSIPMGHHTVSIGLSTLLPMGTLSLSFIIMLVGGTLTSALKDPKKLKRINDGGMIFHPLFIVLNGLIIVYCLFVWNINAVGLCLLACAIHSVGWFMVTVGRKSMLDPPALIAARRRRFLRQSGMQPELPDVDRQ